MSRLIPFQDRPQSPTDKSAAPGSVATIVDVSSHSGRLRAVASQRRPRRDWDPEFHVNLLTF